MGAIDNVGFNKYLAGTEKVQAAYIIAMAAHDGQMRKWTAQPEAYINHPRRVAEIVYTHVVYGDEYYSPTDLANVVCAAFLHDVIEDTAYTADDLAKTFNKDVLSLVLELTDPVFEEGMARDHKFGITVKKWYELSRFASMVKLADRIDNLSDANHAPKNWLKKYLVESSILHAILGPRWPILGDRLSRTLEALKNPKGGALTKPMNGV